MSFNVIKTFNVGDQWDAPELNTYVRDNITAIRKFQTCDQVFTDGANITSTTLVTASAGTYLHLFGGAPPNEPFQMVIVATLYFVNSTTSVVTSNIVDHAGADISGSYPMSCPSTAPYRHGAILGFGQYAAGVDPGFVMRASTSAGTVAFVWAALVHFKPIA